MVSPYTYKNILHINIDLTLEINVENEFESLFLDMSIDNKHIIIGEIYRVPNTNEKLSIHRYETILKKLHNMKAKVLLATDQNFDYLKIQNHKNTLDLFNHFLSSGFIVYQSAAKI